MTPAVAMPGMLSFTHRRVQRLRRLVGRHSVRMAEGAFVLEGPKLLHEALDAGAPVESVYVAAGGLDDAGTSGGPASGDESATCAAGSSTGAVIQRASAAGLRVFVLAPGVLERVAGVVSPQPVMAVCRRVDVDLPAVRGAGLVVVCADVRDPGNLGTVLRSAEAAGGAAVVCCAGSADVYNPKCVRASAGSLFHAPIVAGGKPLEVLATLGTWGVRRLGTRPSGGTPLYEADLGVPVAVVLGNEASGLAPDLETSLDGWLTIPMAGRSESLNVGMTAAVVAFEAARQRGTGTAEAAARGGG